MNNNQEINTKVCACCKIEKNFTEFNKSKTEKYGIQSTCISCCKEYREINKDKIKENNKQYRLINKNKIKEYREINKDKIKELKREYRKHNKDKKRIDDKKYRDKNKDKRNLYEKNRRKYDTNYKLKGNLRSYLNIMLKYQSVTKSIKANDLLGCSLQEFKLHIASQFKEGMSWENHGRNTWHIDHIKPIASFDLTDPEQLKICCHYTNLQPLWAIDNWRKGDKII